MGRKYSKILVTGGAGFIGSHIVDRLLEADYEVTVLDNFSQGCLDHLPGLTETNELKIVTGDILDTKLLKTTIEDMDAIYHEAAITSAPLSIEKPLLTNDINVKGTINLLKTSIEAGVKRFVFASSAAVYGERATVPFSEDELLYPKTPYAVSKVAAEYYAKSFNQIYGLETVCLRYFNVYGPRARSDQGVVSIFLDKIMKNEPLLVYGDGEQRLDYIEVSDVAKANVLALSSDSAVGESINIGTGEAVSVNNIIETFLEVFHIQDLRIINVDPRPGDVKIGYADVRKARHVLGFNSNINLKEGIARLISLNREKLNGY